MADSAKRGQGAARTNGGRTVPRGALGSGMAENAAEAIRNRGSRIDRVLRQATGRSPKKKDKRNNGD